MPKSTSVQQSSTQQLRSTLPEDQVKLADKAQWLDKPYISLPRDQKVSDRLKALHRSLAAPNPEGEFPDKRRILAIVGESGAGKTRALVQHIKQHPAMQPAVDEEGILRDPVLWFRPPSPCTPKRIAFTGLRKLGFLVRESIPENEMWELFRQQLRVHRIRFLVIDEAQDAIEVADKLEKIKIANAFKNLVQMEDWSLRLILAGVPPLEAFLRRKQLLNRSTVVPFRSLDNADGLATVEAILKLIVTDHAAMKLADDLKKDHAERLRHACNADMGTIIGMVRSAVENAMAAADRSVGLEHFKSAYEAASGCDETENIFDSDRWKTLDPLAGNDTEVEKNPYRKPKATQKNKAEGAK